MSKGFGIIERAVLIAAARRLGTVSTYDTMKVLESFGDSRVALSKNRCLSAVISRAVSSLERKGFVKKYKLSANKLTHEGMKIGIRMSICLREGSEVDVATLTEEEQKLVL